MLLPVVTEIPKFVAAAERQRIFSRRQAAAELAAYTLPLGRAAITTVRGSSFEGQMDHICASQRQRLEAYSAHACCTGQRTRVAGGVGVWWLHGTHRLLNPGLLIHRLPVCCSRSDRPWS